jgi:V/A-type H+-transporting ATPase subunit I
MIVNLHKFLIYGAKEEMDRFFTLAQRAGFLEFIGIWQKKALELPPHVKRVLSAIKILRLWEGAEAGIQVKLPRDVFLFAEKVVETNIAHERLLEEQRVLKAEISRIAPFGDFSKNDLEYIESEGKRSIQFFCMKSAHAEEVEIPPELIYLNTEYDLSYYASINKESKQYPKMIEIHIEKPVGVLRERLKDIGNRIALDEAQFRSWAHHSAWLQEGLAKGLNEHELQAVKHDANFPMSDTLFAIEAWVPETRIKNLFALTSTLSVICEEISIETEDRMPTCMENTGPSKVGEDLVQVYEVPSSVDKDPSLWILFFFAIFFAMIIADAGYGLIFLAIGLFIKWKFPRLQAAGKRFQKLIFILGATTVIWGVLTTSFFGMEIGVDSPYRKVSLLHYLAKKKAEYVIETKNDVYQELVHNYPAAAEATDPHDFLLKAVSVRDGKTKYVALDLFYDNVLMEFALVIGIIHLALAFIRYLPRNWPGLGWIIFMVGGYLYLPVSILHATSIVNFMGWVPKPIAHMIGQQLLYGGLGLAVLAALIRSGIMACLLELLNAIQIFSDVLSYIRLYALGLAGMIVAQTFNGLGSKAQIVFGALIVLAGHLVNISLSVMSGVIHGLRLNFLEWYRYCFEGGGKLFNPLRLRKPKH